MHNQRKILRLLIPNRYIKSIGNINVRMGLSKSIMNVGDKNMGLVGVYSVRRVDHVGEDDGAIMVVSP